MGLLLIRLFAFAATAAVMLLFNFENGSLLWSAIQNVGHFLIFTVLSYCLLALFKPDSLNQAINHAVLVLALVSLGGLIELAQNTMPDRTTSWHDLLLDALGIMMGYLIFALTHYYRSLSTSSCVGLIICGLFTGFFATQPALKLTGYHLLKSGSPFVISFGDPFVEYIISVTGRTSIELVKNRLSTDIGSKRILRMNFASDNYGGVIFHDTTKLWTEASYLEFELHNTSNKSREIAMRIQDRHHNNDYHDRYNTKLLVNPGANAVRIPITNIKNLSSNGQNKRQLDIKNIHEIQFFSVDSNTFSLYLSDLHLTPL